MDNEKSNQMIQWSKVIKNGFLATLVMELFYKATNLIFHHGIDVPYANGSMFHFTSPVLTYFVGYFIDFFGGITFSFLYGRFVRPKFYWSGILYAVFFVWLIADGLIFEPMGPAGLFMLDAGLKAVTINLIAHVVYGFVLGFMFSIAGNKTSIRNLTESK
ncbi:hypothetical protein [Paenibacillus terrigena]|uniref:hypothetical protein n=1 Tax=Paenibacillus terrigena TaxID=369333 RepID=UPI0028D4EADA|nr:hypothetical protein [Paenibacillus terrigena]